MYSRGQFVSCLQENGFSTGEINGILQQSFEKTKRYIAQDAGGYARDLDIIYVP